MPDFADIKSRVSLERAAEMLGLAMRVEGKTLRTTCPSCQTTNDRSLCITPQKGYFCQSAKRGGTDCIGLVAHCLGTDQQKGGMRTAAEWLEERTGTSTSTIPSKGTVPVTAPQAQTQGTNPALTKIAERLVHDHPTVLALGLDAETARALSIGFDARGVLKNRVLIPLYRDGALAGFCGFSEDQMPLLKFPSQIIGEQPTMPENVVKFAKRPA